MNEKEEKGLAHPDTEVAVLVSKILFLLRIHVMWSTRKSHELFCLGFYYLREVHADRQIFCSLCAANGSYLGTSAG